MLNHNHYLKNSIYKPIAKMATVTGLTHETTYTCIGSGIAEFTAITSAELYPAKVLGGQ